MNRYIVNKGWEGFADRLQTLSYGISISLFHNRILCVDWSDQIWTHDDKSFYTYFDLVDIPYVTSVHDIPSHLRTFPAFWTGGLGLRVDEWIHRLKDQLTLNVAEWTNDDPIWVFPGVSHRRWDFGQMTRILRLSATAATEIAPLMAAAPVELPVIHLRGTDRPVPEGQWEKLRQTAPVACVISDDKKLVTRWMEESPESVLVSDTLVEGTSAGHKRDVKSLEAAGLTKHRMNIRLLADFLILARAKERLALNPNSVFFKMARLFGDCGGMNTIFQTAPAAHTLQTCWEGYTFQFRPTAGVI